MGTINQHSLADFNSIYTHFTMGFKEGDQTGENGNIERETRSCSGEDLKCALMLGVPGIIALIIILSIIFVCRNRNNNLERGRKALLNYRSAFGQKENRNEKPKRKTSNQTSRNGSMESL